MKPSELSGESPADQATDRVVRFTSVVIAALVALLCFPFLRPAAKPPAAKPTVQPDLEEPARIGVKLRRGETLASVLMRFGLKPPSALAVIDKIRPFLNPRKIQAGHDVQVVLSPEDRTVQGVEFVVNDSLVRVKSTVDGWMAERRDIPSVRETRSIRGTIKDNLYQAGLDAGLVPRQILDLVKIFEYDIDFFSDLQPGDSFTAVIEEIRYADGRRGPGRILGAEVDVSERHFSAFYYISKDGSGSYYDEDGRAVRRSFLRAPLSYTRVSSPFTTERLHPIFRSVQAHQAIDYAAPAGTPVVAIGTGRVEFAGWRNGYGNVVDVRHAGGYLSRYAHFSRFASELRAGKTVAEGQVIGYVGQTGHATGPHLHFEFLRGDEKLNFLALEMPKIDRLAGGDLVRFKRLRDQRLALLRREEDRIAGT